MADVPRDPSFDATLGLARDPYGYLGRRARALGTDVFETRLLGLRTVCFTGPEAARLFYDPARFQRAGAAPAALEKTLFGRGGVQTLDDAAHAHRKRLFVSLLAPDRVAALAARTAEGWQHARLPLYPTAQRVIARAVCAWAGVPLPEADAERRTRQMVSLFDAAGSGLLAHLRARIDRGRADAWIASVIDRVRSGALRPDPETACTRVAHHRELDGRLLDRRTAAVDLLNVLRPTIAVSVYLVCIGYALLRFPGWRHELATPDPLLLDGSCRRCGAGRRSSRPCRRACAHRFRTGTGALLDLHGTNHDPRTWDAPDEFRPERFLGVVPDPFAFVPQGGGDPNVHHRCPGEGVTLAPMKLAVPLLARDLADVPAARLGIDRTRLPALPVEPLSVARRSPAESRL